MSHDDESCKILLKRARRRQVEDQFEEEFGEGERERWKGTQKANVTTDPSYEEGRRR